jgi:putative ABC transport system ATP-binding protein
MARMLELEGVSKSYRTPAEVIVALNEVSLMVEPGEVVAVLGPSGSGKSTLLLLLGAMLSPDDGVIRFRGRDLGTMSERERARHRRCDVGFVFQDYDLFPGMSALENVAFPLWLNRVGWRESKAQAAALIDRVDLSHRASFLPGRLSGGERQRVAVARALAVKPGLVLADEPTGNLDTARGEQVLSELRELAQDQETAVILVTHDTRAGSYADRVCELKDGCLHERADDERHATG